MSTPQQGTGQALLDELAMAALAARNENLELSQVNKLIEVFESERSREVLLVFIARQVGREQWRRRCAARLFKILENAREESEIRRILGLFKWFFEAGGKMRGLPRGLRELANSDKVKQALNNPDASPPKDFYRDYLRAALGLGEGV